MPNIDEHRSGESMHSIESVNSERSHRNLPSAKMPADIAHVRRTYEFSSPKNRRRNSLRESQLEQFRN